MDAVNLFFNDLAEMDTVNVIKNPNFTYFNDGVLFDWSVSGGAVAYDTAENTPLDRFYLSGNGIGSIVQSVDSSYLEPETPYSIDIILKNDVTLTLSAISDGNLQEIFNPLNPAESGKIDVLIPPSTTYKKYMLVFTTYNFQSILENLQIQIVNTGLTNGNLNIKSISLSKGAFETSNLSVTPHLVENTKYDLASNTWQLSNDGTDTKDDTPAGFKPIARLDNVLYDYLEVLLSGGLDIGAKLSYDKDTHRLGINVDDFLTHISHHLTLDDGLLVSGGIVSDGDATVNGDAIIDGSAIINGDTSVAGSLTVTGKLNASSVDISGVINQKNVDVMHFTDEYLSLNKSEGGASAVDGGGILVNLSGGSVFFRAIGGVWYVGNYDSSYAGISGGATAAFTNQKRVVTLSTDDTTLDLSQKIILASELDVGTIKTDLIESVEAGNANKIQALSGGIWHLVKQSVSPSPIATMADVSQGAGLLGRCPVGSIIGVLTTIPNGISVSSGAINSDGFMLCDGAYIPQTFGTTTIYSTPPQRTPDLTDGRFLRGTTVTTGIYGAIGGSDDASSSHIITSEDLPVHTHTTTLSDGLITGNEVTHHNHGTVTLADGSVTIPNVSNSLNATHTHTDPADGVTDGLTSKPDIPHTHKTKGTMENFSIGGGNSTYTYPDSIGGGYFISTGYDEQDHRHTIATTTIDLSHNHTGASVGTAVNLGTITEHQHTFMVPSLVMSTFGSATPSAITIIPHYLNILWFIRVI